jgi:RHS repeat-associated protein
MGSDLRMVARGVLLTCLLSVSSAYAATGSAIYIPSAATPAAPPDPYPVTYQSPVTDLSVKVWGGNVVIQRAYHEGVWYSNINWMPLTLTYDSFDGTVKTVTRSHTDYSKVAPGVYQDKYHNTFRQIATGFHWNDPSANWIEYNLAGEIKAYGDRNGTIASFQYSAVTGSTTTGTATPASEGVISGILDHYGVQVFWFDYDASNQLIRVRDAANRKVEYQSSTPFSNSIALAVLDANGNTWNYSVSGIRPQPPVTTPVLGGGGGGGGGSAIYVPSPPPPPDSACRGGAVSMTIADPEGHSTTRSWYVNGSLSHINQADGSIVCINQDYDPAKKVFYTREFAPYIPASPADLSIPAGTKLTETWFELTQDRSRGEFLRRDVNGITVATQSVDTANRITTNTDARGLNTAITKDQWDNITKVVYPDASSISNQYDPTYSNVTQHIDENGSTTQNSYDSKGNLLKTVEAVGLAEQRTTEYTYDADNQRISQTRKGDANTADAVTRYAYDGNGNVLTVTDPENGITRYTYDVMGNALTKLDPNGKLWKRTYDNTSHLLSVTDPLNRTTSIAYDKTGLPISLTDAANNTSTLGYDPAGKLLTVTDSYNAKTSYSYDAAGNPVTLTDAANHTQKQDYDIDGNLAKQTDGNNNVTQFVYGDVASGFNRLLVKIIYPTLSQDLQYDQRNRITQSTDTAAGSAIALDGASSQSSKNQYDAVGNLTVVIDPANRNSGTRYDSLGRVNQTTDPANGTTQYGYDARGNLVSVQDAKGNTHRFAYDRLDRMVMEIRPLGQTITYAYDPNGNLTQVTDPKGQVKIYTYDVANRRTREDHYLTAAAVTAQNAVKSISYSYNTLDRLTGYNSSTSSLQASNSATYTYDTKQLRQTGESVNYGTFSLGTSTGYNALGQKSNLTYPDGASYSYTYDTNNQLSTVNLPTGFGSITFNSYQWTVPSQITLPGGTVRTQDYDGLLRLKDFSVKDPGQSQVLNYQYSYDTTNNITTKVTEAGTTSYGYDTLDRLTAATYTGQATAQANEAYSYDQLANRLTDNRTTATWVYNANNQLVTADSITYTYDDNGNTSSQTDSVNAANTRNYVYDTDNRLVEVRDNTNTLIAAYSYDPFGRRLSKDTGSSKTYFFYNAEGLIAEADASGAITKTYGYAPGSTFSTNPLWLKATATGSTTANYYYYQNDHLGTPMKLLNQSGVTVWSATYDSFGKATVDPSSTITNNLRFPGQYYDAETGLHYNWARYYDPTTGRYVTSDPIGLRGGFNTYTYVHGRPLMYIDPYGLFGMADMPTIPQGVVDFSAGWGDMLSFGITSQVRNLMGTNGMVDKCSGAYKGGEAFGFANGLALGWVQGMKSTAKSLSPVNWQNFSHSLIPNRILNRLEAMGIPGAKWLNKIGNRLNGDHIPTTGARGDLHDLMDSTAAAAGMNEAERAAFVPWPEWRELINRMPYVPGSAIYGGGSAVMNSNCGCQ